MFIHRNDPCYCQSGEKYKNCCSPKDRDKLLFQRKPKFNYLQIFPTECIGKKRGAPYYKYAQEIFEKEKDRWDYHRVLKHYKEGGNEEIHGVTYEHLHKNGLFPIEIYQSLKMATKHDFQVWFTDFVMRQFRNYLKWTKRRNNYIFCYDFDDKNGCFVEMKTRYSEKYRRKVKNVMNAVKRKHSNAMCVLLNLDVAPQFFNYNPVKAWREIRKYVHDFNEAVRLHLKRYEKRDLPEYICVIEPYTGKKNKKGRESPAYGFPHVHIVYLDATRLCDWTKIKQYWKLGERWKINRTMDGKKVKYPINYVTKYVTKTFTETNEDNLLPQALLWFFGMRSYTNSRHTVPPLNSSSSPYRALCMVLIHPDKDLTEFESDIYCYVTDIMKVAIDT